MTITNKKFNKRKKFNKSRNVKKTRKEMRKENRKLKKCKRNEYYMNKKGKSNELDQKKVLTKDTEKNKKSPIEINSMDILTKQRKKEEKEQQKLKKQMQKQRTKQLLEANESEDKIIKKLEKQLKLNKKKSSNSITKSFAGDGLDYILEMCDSETRKTLANAHKSLTEHEIEAEFEDDLIALNGKRARKDSDRDNDNFDENDSDDFDEQQLEEDNMKLRYEESTDENNSEMENIFFDLDESDDENDNKKLNKNKKFKKTFTESSETDSEDGLKPQKRQELKKNKSNYDSHESDSNDRMVLEPKKRQKLNKNKKDCISYESDSEEEVKSKKKQNLRKNKSSYASDDDVVLKSKKQKKLKKNKNNKSKKDYDSDESDYEKKVKPKKKIKLADSDKFDSDNSESSLGDESDQSSETGTKDETNEWEDIYGKKRDKDGNIISQTTAYVPPALRNEPSDKEKAAMIRLKREMKGLINRVTASNMISVSQQMESLYNRGDNSRHNLNNTFCDLINEAIIQSVITPVQIIIDYAILIAILHANIDTEIGAIYLERIIQKYDQILKTDEDNGNKELDNVVHIISVLYNLKVVHCTMIHDILRNLITNGLTERNLECILLMLKTVGPILRKDDLVLMKETLECIHDTINSTPEDVKSKQSSRLKYLVDVLTSIKNNNFMKIPNYSPDDVPQMRKVLRNALRPGNQVVQLNISLDDLLNVNKRGKWWIVGSAWTGVNENENSNKKKKNENLFELSDNDRLLKLAKKFRMNTENRKRVFVTLMSANDVDEAYEKLLRLGLSKGQDHEIINVILIGCINELKFNQFYSVLALKFCDLDRKYKIWLRNSIWDKFKEIDDTWNVRKIHNLGLFLIQMFLNNGLTISVLKAINLSDLNIPLLRFLRVTLCGILIVEDTEIVTRIWSRAGDDIKFKEALRIFIEQFLLRPNVLSGLEPHKRALLESRGRIALKMLQKDRRHSFSL